MMGHDGNHHDHHPPENWMEDDSYRRRAPAAVLQQPHDMDDVSEITEAFTLPICSDASVNWMHSQSDKNDPLQLQVQRPPSYSAFAQANIEGPPPTWDHPPLYEQEAQEHESQKQDVDYADYPPPPPGGGLQSQMSTQYVTRDGTRRSWLARQQQEEFEKIRLHSSRFNGNSAGSENRNHSHSPQRPQHQHRRTRSAGWEFGDDDDYYDDEPADPANYYRPRGNYGGLVMHRRGSNPSSHPRIPPRSSILDEPLPGHDPLHYNEADDYSPPPRRAYSHGHYSSNTPVHSDRRMPYHRDNRNYDQYPNHYRDVRNDDPYFGRQAPLKDDRHRASPRARTASYSDDRVVTNPRANLVSEPHSDDRIITSPHGNNTYSRDRMLQAQYDNNRSRPKPQRDQLRYASNHEPTHRYPLDYDHMSQSHYDDRHRGRYSPTSPSPYDYDNRRRPIGNDLYRKDEYERNGPNPLSDSRSRSKSPNTQNDSHSQLMEALNESSLMEDTSSADEFIENFNRARMERIAQRRAARERGEPIVECRGRSRERDPNEDSRPLYPKLELPKPGIDNSMRPNQIKLLDDDEEEEDILLPDETPGLIPRRTSAERRGSASLQGSHGHLPSSGPGPQSNHSIAGSQSHLHSSHGHNSIQSLSGSSRDNNELRASSSSTSQTRLSPRPPGRSTGSRLADIEAEEKLRKFEEAKAKLGVKTDRDAEAEEKRRKFEEAKAKLNRPGHDTAESEVTSRDAAKPQSQPSRRMMPRSFTTGGSGYERRPRSRNTERGTMSRPLAAADNAGPVGRLTPEQRGIKHRSMSGDFGGRIGNYRISPMKTSEIPAPATTTTGGVGDRLGAYRNQAARHSEIPDPAATYGTAQKITPLTSPTTPVTTSGRRKIGRSRSVEGEYVTPRLDGGIECLRELSALSAEQVGRDALPEKNKVPDSPFRRNKSHGDESKPSRGRLFKKLFQGSDGKKGQGNAPGSN